MSNNNYEQIIQSKMDEIEQTRVKREAEYEEEQRLLKEKYDVDIKQLEETKDKILMLQKITSEELTLESLEKFESIINQIELSEAEQEAVWTFLALTSIKLIARNKEKPIIQEKIEPPVIEESVIEGETITPKENNKRITKKRYETKEDQIDLTEWNNLSKKDKKSMVESLFDTIKKQYAKRIKDEEEFNYKCFYSNVYNDIINEGIIKYDDDFSRVMSEYNYLYQTMEAEYLYLNKKLGNKIDISDDTYKHLIDLQSCIDNCRKAFNEIAKIHKTITTQKQAKEEIETELETDIRDVKKEPIEEKQKRESVVMFENNPDILKENAEEEHETIEAAQELLDKYNAIKDNPKYANNSSLKSIHSSIEVLKQYMNMGKAEKEAWKEYINDTINGIITSIDEEIETVFFPKINNEYSNIGSQNIILFLENEEGISTIEDDLDNLDAGEQKQIASELKYSLESKYKENSWITNLKIKSDHLKGSKVRIGKQDSEIWNCKCGTKKTRMSLWPITVNADTKQKLKEEYNLPDTFESVLLVCDIAPSHRIDYLQSKANKNSARISRVNSLFSNPDVSFEQIKEIIKNSSAAYDRISARAKEMK